MNKPTFRCVELYDLNPTRAELIYVERINEIIAELEEEGYTYYETVVVNDRILIYFKLTLYKFDNSTSTT